MKEIITSEISDKKIDFKNKYKEFKLFVAELIAKKSSLNKSDSPALDHILHKGFCAEDTDVIKAKREELDRLEKEIGLSEKEKNKIINEVAEEIGVQKE